MILFRFLVLWLVLAWLTSWPVLRWILLVAIVACLVLACAAPARPPQTHTVETAVAEPCITEVPAAPDFETRYLQATDDLCAITDALMIERRQWMIYTEQLLAEIAGCVIEDQ